MTEIIYKRGDPKTTQFVRQLYLIAALIEVTTHYYLTATHWGDVVAELNAQYRENLWDQTLPAPWDVKPNGPMQIGKKDPILWVHNAGTDDEQVVYLLNNEQPMVEAFGKRRDALRTG